ncbi:MAG: PAS domain S-box protein [Methanomicrobiales archaeon]|nr:PAS domain S-box protein [Methanomicrobiales archaeon]
MVWQYSPYYIAFLAGGAISLILAVTGWRNRTIICAKPFALLMLAVSVWSFGAALEVSSSDPGTQMLAIMLQYPGIVTVPVAWLLFSFEYSGREYWITRQNLFLLFLVPAFCVMMVATNNYHHLFYSVFDQSVVDGIIYADITYGPVFWFNIIYAYLIIYIAIMLILQRFVYSSSVYRGQMVAILIAVFIPFFVNIAYAIRQISFTVIDPTPLAFIISGIAILIGIVRYQLLDITPMAHDLVIANMSDGMVVVDTLDRIISLNAPAERFIGVSLKGAVGVPVHDLLPCVTNAEHRTGEECRIEEMHEMNQTIDGEVRHFELRISPILTRQAGVRGRIIMIRDITKQRKAEDALAVARKKVDLLSSITRHDILNQVTVLLLNIDTFRSGTRDPEMLELIHVQENAVENIQHQIEFARDYEKLGVNAPQWMNVMEIFYHLMPVMGTYNITFHPPDMDIEIFSDQLLERVFYNLVNNSIEHGQHVTTISLCSIPTDAGLTILYEDNGVGVPPENKERIFERGFGRHTGLGLFLAKEILGITGLSIRESGVFGTGVRFEIRVPPGQFRIRT